MRNYSYSFSSDYLNNNHYKNKAIVLIIYCQIEGYYGILENAKLQMQEKVIFCFMLIFSQVR